MARAEPVTSTGFEDNYNRFGDTEKIQLYADLTPGYINRGMIRPDDPPEMTVLEGNEAKIEYIIKKLGITEESNVLDLGCGLGMFIAQISKRTGCRFVGTDLSLEHLEISKKTAEDLGVGDKGTFIQSTWEEPNESVRANSFTLFCLIKFHLN